MGKYDGTVRIDSRIDTAGFNKGIRNIGISMKMAAAGIAVGFAAAAVGIAFVLRKLFDVGKAIFDAGIYTAKYAKKAEELKESFARLKTSIADAFRPLILAALPWIQQVVSWVQALLSLVAQVTAGLTGQSGYWKTTATAASGAADATKEVAENTKKAGEAAEGALASFDDLNVLSMAKEQDTAAGGGGTAAGTSQEWVPLGEKALGIVDKIKAAFESIKLFFEPLLEPLGRIWDAFKRIWEQIKIAAGAIWEDLTPAFEWFRDNVLVPILDALAILFEKIATWAEENPEAMKGIIAAFMLLAVVILLIISPLAQAIALWLVFIALMGLLIKYWPEISAAAITAWEWVKQAAIDAWNWIKNIWEGVANWFKSKVIDPVKEFFAPMITWLGTAFSSAWESIKLVWKAVAAWFKEKVTDPISKGWKTFTEGLSEGWNKAWDSISKFFKGVINGIIDGINRFLSGFIGGINKILSGLNSLGNVIPGWKSIPTLGVPQIPRLASGAVIPPNASFLAMLGDQRHGTNIEAPEELIRQIVREEGGGGKEVTINFAGSLGALVRELKPYIDKENNRIGRSLVKGSIS